MVHSKVISEIGKHDDSVAAKSDGAGNEQSEEKMARKRQDYIEHFIWRLKQKLADKAQERKLVGTTETWVIILLLLKNVFDHCIAQLQWQCCCYYPALSS